MSKLFIIGIFILGISTMAQSKTVMEDLPADMLDKPFVIENLLVLTKQKLNSYNVLADRFGAAPLSIVDFTVTNCRAAETEVSYRALWHCSISAELSNGHTYKSEESTEALKRAN